MSYPDYEELADALLCFIYRYGGGKYQVRANETYGPLANFFYLTHEEKTRSRLDGYSGSLWENRIQWTRQRLINKGYAEKREYEIWGLTDEGVQCARSIVNSYRNL